MQILSGKPLVNKLHIKDEGSVSSVWRGKIQSLRATGIYIYRRSSDRSENQTATYINSPLYLSTDAHTVVMSQFRDRILSQQRSLTDESMTLLLTRILW